MTLKCNECQSADAFECVDAYRSGILLTPEVTEERLSELSSRMTGIYQRSGQQAPSYLFAAYRGYEDALLFVTHQHVPSVVVLNQSQYSVKP